MPPTLSISSKNLDDVLEGVKRKISRDRLVEVSLPTDEIVAELKVHSSLGHTFGTLDLVSHSSGAKSLLLLGDGVPEESRCLIEKKRDNRWMAILRSPSMMEQFEKLGVKRLRLLGCLTAFRRAGRDTMKELKKVLGLDEVFGTKGYLTADDFDAGGFKAKSEVKLVSCTDLDNGQYIAPAVPPEPPESDVLGLDFGKVPTRTPKELCALRASPECVRRTQVLQFGKLDVQRLHDHVGNVGQRDGASLFSLLSVPSHEYWIECHAQRGRYRLLQVLFDWRMVRVFSPDLMRFYSPPGHTSNPLKCSAVYRVAHPRALKQFFLERAHRPKFHPPSS